MLHVVYLCACLTLNCQGSPYATNITIHHSKTEHRSKNGFAPARSRQIKKRIKKKKKEKNPSNLQEKKKLAEEA
ncbi:hypothetical protein I7I50_09374 [Histoplasma capsulatum G186AR]|uniref:Secreted protein n=1 Tax=Ajellomyces capsulatus TaxID=5037 RepID=A0A8H7YPV1_AJECA|nr:hypothetical protein I7I52_06895 [Histoplasma capsulatum]QSS74271.1 hypothetical protein I7I50_09374 [Histoplasma capsulatum G186AR]